jgi:2-keto-4-pentenoate hydratase/2-oxohepta-3-ene-1,7-dioic acid hydratase in catechol pathway
MTEAAAVPDPHGLLLTTRVNGEVVQQASTADLIFPIDVLIAYISAFTPLSPGDVIVTGTPAGIGARQTPPRFLRAGDHVEVEIDGLGKLENTVVEESLGVMG